MALSEEAIVSRVRELVAGVLGLETGAVPPEAPLEELAELDSLSFAEIASALDHAFAIRVPAAEVAGGSSVAGLAAVVGRLVAESAR